MRGLAIAVCLVCVVPVSVASAETDGATLFAAAKAAMDGSPTKAAAAVDTALRAGHHDRNTTARLYAMAGEVAAAQGDIRGAEADFRRMLAIDPSVRPRRSYAAEVGPVYDRMAAQAQKSGPLKVDVRAGDNNGIIVRVTSDPVGVVSGAWAEYTTTDGETREVLLPGRGGTAFLLPGRKPGTPVAAGVVDEYGNRLAQITVGQPAAEPVARPVAKAEPAPAKTEPTPVKTQPKARPKAIEPEPEPEIEPEPAIEPEPLGPLTQKKPLYRRWPLWAGAAGATAVAAGYFAWDTAKAEDEADRLAADSGGHTYEELLAVEDRGKRSALLTNVFVGTSAALVLTSAVMAFWPDDDRPASARSSVRVQVGRSSVGVAVDF